MNEDVTQTERRHLDTLWLAQLDWWAHPLPCFIPVFAISPIKVPRLTAWQYSVLGIPCSNGIWLSFLLSLKLFIMKYLFWNSPSVVFEFQSLNPQDKNQEVLTQWKFCVATNIPCSALALGLKPTWGEKKAFLKLKDSPHSLCYINRVYTSGIGSLFVYLIRSLAMLLILSWPQNKDAWRNCRFLVWVLISLTLSEHPCLISTLGCDPNSSPDANLLLVLEWVPELFRVRMYYVP